MILDIAVVKAIAREAAMGELTLIALDIEAEAKARAPVRRVDKEKPRSRKMTLSERVSMTAAQPKEKRVEFRKFLREHGSVITNVYRNKYENFSVIASGNKPKGLSGRGSYEWDNALKLRGNGKNARSSGYLTNKADGAVVRGEAAKQFAALAGKNLPLARAQAHAMGYEINVGGRLKRSIAYSVTKNGVVIGAYAPYALYVEFPTRHNRAQPFLLPAFKRYQRTIEKRVLDSVLKAIAEGGA